MTVYIIYEHSMLDTWLSEKMNVAIGNRNKNWHKFLNSISSKENKKSICDVFQGHNNCLSGRFLHVHIRGFCDILVPRFHGGPTGDDSG